MSLIIFTILSFIGLNWIALLYLNKIIGLEFYPFFALVYIGHFLIFSLGLYLLAQNLFRSSKASLYILITILFGGFFIPSLLQPNALSITAKIAWIILLIRLGIQKKNLILFLGAAIFSGIQLNYYIPSSIYLPVYLTFLPFLVFFFVRKGKQNSIPDLIFKFKTFLREHFFSLLACLALFFLSFGPGLLAIFDIMASFSSPSRGNTAVSLSDPIKSTQMIIKMTPANYASMFIHSSTEFHKGNFVGPFTMGLAFLGAFTSRASWKWPFLIGGTLVFFFSTGFMSVSKIHSESLLFLAKALLPGISYIRHFFGFSTYFIILAVFLAATGLEAIQRDQKEGKTRFKKFMLLALFSLPFCLGQNKSISLWFVFFLSLLPPLFSFLSKKKNLLKKNPLNEYFILNTSFSLIHPSFRATKISSPKGPTL